MWREEAKANSGVSEFRSQVLELCYRIPKGRVSTYGEIARQLETSPRAVGNALRHNPYAPLVPCHRVVATSGGIGGFSGAKDPTSPEIARKVALLRSEGVSVADEGKAPIVDKSFFHKFPPEDAKEAKELWPSSKSTKIGVKRVVAASPRDGMKRRKRFVPSLATPKAVWEACRTGSHSGPTAGLAPGYAQFNLVVLPQTLGDAFRRFCELNSQPCPLVASTKTREAPSVGAGADLSKCLPLYRVWRDGKVSSEVPDVSDVWGVGDVWGGGAEAFLLGCSFGFEEALQQGGVPVRHIEMGCNVPMYVTSRKCSPSGPFRGPLVVSMRPIPKDLVEKASHITSAFPLSHGAPIHVGDPTALGISDIAKPDFGDPVAIHPGEVPVFWACGVTPQLAIQAAKPPIAITHSPGHMFIGSVKNEDLAATSTTSSAGGGEEEM